ncbi:MAG: hypothetical protein EWV76_23935 [Microcystis novacekii Mn_MB_F_20050700_S1]|jgi:hypothetical protein|uniref:Glycosyltransferase family 1 protein n=1 Tax=Microcystis novacekii Mn_MB_F_20050700_S1D TaxID=2486266 RepID=A0A552IHF6_9CHRO|nr:MAG: hypothetical protein EWV76_23935 [Microcystis novacekii Mn_MB_F_20050700_S1]TRU82907.1 MAG: hypothetical protein EWV54_21110 [Microcystis novacekii Mn_MB_F_20050700_S1D]
MTEQIPPIYFHLPASHRPDPLPDHADQLRTGRGSLAWILQTYLRLRESNFPCELVDTIPKEGIVIGHRESLAYDFQPYPKLLLACVKGDQNPQPYAQIHIVQNRQELTASQLYIQSISEDQYLLPGKRYFLPHWTQPGLIPRDPQRGDRFENVVYLGISYNLAPPLRKPEWQQQLEHLGLNWCIQTNDEFWHDYRQADAIVAIRRFDSKETYPWKPPTKLYNAWLAGVPAILGNESAFQAEYKNELDFFTANNENDVIYYLKQLRDNSYLRQQIKSHYQERSKTVTISYLVHCWHQFILNECVPAYNQWCSLSLWQQKQFFLRRRLLSKLNQLQMKTLKIITAQ